jgi:WD40 repeat protein
VGCDTGVLGGFDFTTGEKLFEILQCHHSAVSALEIAATRRFFASGGKDAAVRIWDVRTRELMTHFKAHSMAVTSLSFVPNAQFLYSASADKSVCLYDLKEEKMIERMTQFESHVTDLEVTGDSLITATQDGHLSEFCISQGTKPLKKVRGEETTFMSVSPDGSKFVVGHVSGAVSLWDRGSFKKIETITVHGHSVSDIRFYADDRVMTSGSDGGISVIEVK